MQKEKNKLIISYALVVICMAVIFWLSSRTATESSGQSARLLEFLIKLFGDNFFTDFIVRKSAHFLEFTGLSLLCCNAFFQSKRKYYFIWGVMLSSLYAVSDEVHQLFVEGRACRFFDWVIDTSGAIFGAIIFVVLIKIIIFVINKKKNLIDSKNN